ncbi:MAG TPA: long-chain-fatty-acid--CoA ligase [Roseiarcus sp.]|nr:long-chain-fatty-acid--CoA ligase [Roseiarcus sp.]
MIELDGVASVADVARVQALRRGSAPALVFEGRAMTFADVDAMASRLANALIASGVRTQARIAYLSKNTDHFLPCLMGACKARAALAPFNFRLAAPEIARLLEDSEARIMFVGPDVVDLADQAVASLVSKPRMIALGFDRQRYERYDAWIDSAAPQDPLLEADPQDDVVQLYTSGTTGLPKGVQLTNRNYLALFELPTVWGGLNYRTGDTVLAAMPFFHVAGINVALIAMASGARSAILRDATPQVILDTISKERINHAFLAPALIQMLMQARGIESADFSSMRTLTYGASPISEDLLKRASVRFGCEFVQLYGMTETSGAGTFLADADHDPAKGKLRSCGVAWPGVELKIVSAEGLEVPRGTVGEVVIRSPVVMKGYWNKPDATSASIRDGWMRTGDAAYMDNNGYVFIYDRVKDMIVTGGENVYPAEVENALFGHPAISDAAVIGVPDGAWGEAVKAIVVLKPGAPRDAAGILAWARARIANFKTPKSVDFVDVIPRNLSGKILRRELREPYWKGRDRRVN